MITKAIPRLAITQSEIFSSWPEEEVEQLVQVADCVRLGEGAVLHRPGDIPEYLYLIATGSLRLSKAASAGREFTIRLCFSGDFHGLGPLISEVPYIYTATCREDTLLVRIPGEFLLQMLRKNGHLALAMFAELNKRHRRIVGLYSDAATHTVRIRIAILLEMLSVRRNQQETQALYVLQNEIAELLGSRRQVVNRELRVMEAEGILRLEYGHITVVDREKLHTLASSLVQGNAR